MEIAAFRVKIMFQRQEAVADPADCRFPGAGAGEPCGDSV